MGMVSQSGQDQAALVRERERRRVTTTAGQAAPAGDADEAQAEEEHGALYRAVKAVVDYLPKGNTLDTETFRSRHLLLCWILALHPGPVPARALAGLRPVPHWRPSWRCRSPPCCSPGRRPPRRLASFFTTAGLVYCSVVLVHLSGGMIEAHFHFFVLIGLIALYQDWVPFLWNVLFTVASAGGSAIAETLIFNHDSGQDQPWTWALIHGVAVLALRRRHRLLEEHRGTAGPQHRPGRRARNRRARPPGGHVRAARQPGPAQPVAPQPPARGHHRPGDPGAAARRPRGAVPPRPPRHPHPPQRRIPAGAVRRRPAPALGQPVPLGDVVRAAAAEVEDYRQVEVLVNDHIDVAGRAVADLAHLLAELIENATTFSPPSSDVRIRSHLSPGESTRFVVTIEDIGIGMSAEDMAAANIVLAEAPQIDLRRATMLGFHVVARLAQRYDIQVRLPPPRRRPHRPGQPARELISDRPADAPPPPTTTTTISAKDRHSAPPWRGAVAPAGRPPTPRPGPSARGSSPRSRPRPPRAGPAAPAPAWLDSVPMPDWLNAPGPTRAGPAAGRPAPPPPRPRSLLAEPVMPGTRLGPVAEWIDVLRARSTRRPPHPHPRSRPPPRPPPGGRRWSSPPRGRGRAPHELATAEPLAAGGRARHARPAPAVTPTPTATAAPPAGRSPRPAGTAWPAVPGTHLAPALRRDAGDDGDADAATQGGSRDVERVRAMLSLPVQPARRPGRRRPTPRRPPEENR